MIWRWIAYTAAFLLVVACPLSLFYQTFVQVAFNHGRSDFPIHLYISLDDGNFILGGYNTMTFGPAKYHPFISGECFLRRWQAKFSETAMVPELLLKYEVPDYPAVLPKRPRRYWEASFSISTYYFPSIAAASVVKTNRRRRPRFGPGCCGACGYDLRGNPAGACPECGDESTTISA